MGVVGLGTEYCTVQYLPSDLEVVYWFEQNLSIINLTTTS